MAAQASSLRDPAAQPGHDARARQVATCSLCGLERPIGLMVPDGGQACADLRWYCKDTQSCTQRWTSGLREPGPPEPESGPDGDQPGPDGDQPELARAEAAAVEQRR